MQPAFRTKLGAWTPSRTTVQIPGNAGPAGAPEVPVVLPGPAASYGRGLSEGDTSAGTARLALRAARWPLGAGRGRGGTRGDPEPFHVPARYEGVTPSQ